MGKRVEPKVTLVAEGEPIPGREWVTSGVIPDESEAALIERGYEFLGDDNLGDVAVPFDVFCGFQSTRVLRAGWWLTHTGPDAGSLFVVFLSQAVVRYDCIPYGIWHDFFASPSHGRYIGEVLSYIEHVELRADQVSVTAEMRQSNYTRAS